MNKILNILIIECIKLKVETVCGMFFIVFYSLIDLHFLALVDLCCSGKKYNKKKIKKKVYL